jgi:hypothetical protein
MLFVHKVSVDECVGGDKRLRVPLVADAEGQSVAQSKTVSMAI